MESVGEQKMNDTYTNAMLAQTEEALLTLEYINELIARMPLDSVQWFYMTAFLNDMGQHMEKIRTHVDSSRPSKPVRQMLLESYAGVVSA